MNCWLNHVIGVTVTYSSSIYILWLWETCRFSNVCPLEGQVLDQFMFPCFLFPWSLQMGWTRWPLKIPSNPNYSMILTCWLDCFKFYVPSLRSVFSQDTPGSTTKPNFIPTTYVKVVCTGHKDLILLIQWKVLSTSPPAHYSRGHTDVLQPTTATGVWSSCTSEQDSNSATPFAAESGHHSTGWLPATPEKKG